MRAGTSVPTIETRVTVGGALLLSILFLQLFVSLHS